MPLIIVLKAVRYAYERVFPLNDMIGRCRSVREGAIGDGGGLCRGRGGGLWAERQVMSDPSTLWIAALHELGPARPMFRSQEVWLWVVSGCVAVGWGDGRVGLGVAGTWEGGWIWALGVVVMVSRRGWWI